MSNNYEKILEEDNETLRDDLAGQQESFENICDQLYDYGELEIKLSRQISHIEAEYSYNDTVDYSRMHEDTELKILKLLVADLVEIRKKHG